MLERLTHSRSVVSSNLIKASRSFLEQDIFTLIAYSTGWFQKLIQTWIFFSKIVCFTIELNKLIQKLKQQSLGVLEITQAYQNAKCKREQFCTIWHAVLDFLLNWYGWNRVFVYIIQFGEVDNDYNTYKSKHK